MKKTILWITAGVVFITIGCYSATIMVPEEYMTIQEGIDNSSSGDTVLVGPGIYFELVRIWENLDIVLASSNGPQLTIIDGMNQGTVLEIHEGRVDGFTIRNGCNSTSAGGVTISGEATITNCWIINNIGEKWGGGINSGFQARATIVNNLISNNNCYVYYDNTGFPADDSYGAGIFFEQGTISALVANNTIYGNVCHGSEDGTYVGKGGAIWITTGEISIVNNIITNNEAGECPAVAIYGATAEVVFENNNIWNNYGSMNSCNAPESEMSVDPLLYEGPLGNYYLSQTAAGQEIDSPCVDAGNNSSIFWSLDSLTTRTDNVVDEGVVDLGYHYPIGDINIAIPTIETNQFLYQTGDQFILTLHIINAGQEKTLHVCVVLEVAQNFWFWPAWSKDIDYEIWSLPSNEMMEYCILNFMWPESEISGDARFWAATTDAKAVGFQGGYDFCDFAYQ